MAAALCDAKAHREELVREGILKPPKPQQPRQTMVRGLTYHKTRKHWQVKMRNPITKKKVHAGCFRKQEEAEVKARELAKELGIKDIEHKVVPVKKFSELKHFEPLGPQPGVRWNLDEQCWRATYKVAGKQSHMRFRPKDFSEKEVEKAWKQAVAWRKQREKERDQTKKCLRLPSISDLT